MERSKTITIKRHIDADAEEAFEAFVGASAMESDGGWSRDVWMASWEAARSGFKQCNMCGSMVAHVAQPDLPNVPQS